MFVLVVFSVFRNFWSALVRGARTCRRRWQRGPRQPIGRWQKGVVSRWQRTTAWSVSLQWKRVLSSTVSHHCTALHCFLILIQRCRSDAFHLLFEFWCPQTGGNPSWYWGHLISFCSPLWPPGLYCNWLPLPSIGNLSKPGFFIRLHYTVLLT